MQNEFDPIYCDGKKADIRSVIDKLTGLTSGSPQIQEIDTQVNFLFVIPFCHDTHLRWNSFNIMLRSSWLTSSARLGSEGQLSEFIEGLGPGQLVGRQVLASPALGDIQLSMQDKRGHLEVEVIRARGLCCKPGSKTLPGKKS